ncbi:17013_t:CDS:2 [Entrophospora sp. SA101]|nr:13997_t:CDS:2 [Entrophospora sp. SA101]CAJ0854768.1 17013_t:CDS:2 [Entrophospora sp. SA101]
MGSYYNDTKSELATGDTSVNDSSIDSHHAFNDISNITLPFKRSKT